MTAASVGFQCPECVSEGRKTIRQGRTIYGGRVYAQSGRMGPVTTVLIAVNVVLFIATSTNGVNFASNNVSSKLFVRLALLPPAVAHGEYYRIVTSMFLHFSVIHIAFNMYALFLIGTPLEVVLGRVRYLALYFLAGIGGSVLTMLNGPIAEEAAGASGAIFGLFAAFYFVARRQGWQTNGIVITIALNLALSFSFSSEIDWRGHVGGLIVGGVVMVVIANAPVGPRRFQLQALGVVAVAILLAGLAVVGVHRVNTDCKNQPSTFPSASQVTQTAAFCAVYDPQ